MEDGIVYVEKDNIDYPFFASIDGADEGLFMKLMQALGLLNIL